MNDARLESLEDFLAAAQMLHVARADLPWAWGRLLYAFNRPQMDDVVQGSAPPGAMPPTMGRYYTYAEAYPWFPDENDRDRFPSCLDRSQTLTWSHHLLLYVRFLKRETPDHEAAERWLQKADEESWKFWQLRKALGGGDPTPEPYITVKVKGKAMEPAEAKRVFADAGHNEVLLASDLVKDDEMRRAAASMLVNK